MQNNRSKARESAFILLFEKMFRDETENEIIELAENIEDFYLNKEVVSIFNGVLENKEEINEIISKYSEKRSFDRIPKVNLAIIQIAVYETLYCEKVPVNVAISEAVALGEKYGQDADVAFINGVLGKYSRDLKEQNNG